MGASYYVLAAAEGSTHHYLLMAGNSYQISNLSRKHTWVLPSVTSSTGHSVGRIKIIPSQELYESDWYDIGQIR